MQRFRGEVVHVRKKLLRQAIFSLLYTAADRLTYNGSLVSFYFCDSMKSNSDKRVISYLPP